MSLSIFTDVGGTVRTSNICWIESTTNQGCTSALGLRIRSSGLPSIGSFVINPTTFFFGWLRL